VHFTPGNHLLDKDLIHFQRDNGFITDEVHDEILNPQSMWTEAQKAREMAKWITKRVKLDPESFHTLLSHFKHSGVRYLPIAKTLEDEYKSLKSNPGHPSPLVSVSSPIKVYQSYLKSKYLEQKIPNYDKWPPSPSIRYINLVVLEGGSLPMDRHKELTYCNNMHMSTQSITFDDIAKPDEDGVLPKLVLVEGAPGVGKSTFAWEACRKWAKGEILQEFDLVVLIKLRSKSARKATCLGDLIQYPRDPDIRQKVIQDVTKTGGEGVLLLLDGYDELQDEDSLFAKVINGDQLDAGTVLLTSRHWASESLLLPRDTNRPVSQHVEIRGFTAEDVGDYISSVLKNEPMVLKDLKQYLEVCPHIRSMMYIPLNSAIVLEVYRKSKKENLLMPKTMTELYSSLILSLLRRHIHDTYPENKSFKMKDLKNLPSCVSHHFLALSKLAYVGICENSKQVVFSEEEIPGDLDSLGLMQSGVELHIDVGAEKSYSFHHLTIQEFLAAYHISTLPVIEQLKHFLINVSLYGNETRSHDFNREIQMVTKFLAGLSPSTFQMAESKINFIQDNMYIHALFEAKIEPSHDVPVYDREICIAESYSS
jgi:hypothetical protein